MAKGRIMSIQRVLRFLDTDDAATAAEYAVLLALILLALISAVTSVGNSTSGLWQSDVTQVSNATGGS
jgi:pilus assembly protein Flp/PilA